MRITIVVAVADNRVIGMNNDLPWHMPADLKFFKNTTMGHYVLMGRKSFEALGKPLSGRTNIIVTRDAEYKAEGCIVVQTIDEGLAVAEKERDELMILGGATIYEQLLPRTDRIYISEIHGEPEGDTLFPEFDRSEWVETERQDFPADEKNKYPYSFVTLDRKR